MDDYVKKHATLSINEELQSCKEQLTTLPILITQYEIEMTTGWVDESVQTQLEVIARARAEIERIHERHAAAATNAKRTRARLAAVEQRIKLLKNQRAVNQLVKLHRKLADEQE